MGLEVRVWGLGFRASGVTVAANLWGGVIDTGSGHRVLEHNITLRGGRSFCW